MRKIENLIFLIEIGDLNYLHIHVHIAHLVLVNERKAFFPFRLKPKGHQKGNFPFGLNRKATETLFGG